jgi:carbonic anhydrase
MTSKHLQDSHQRIFDNNRKWVASMKAQDPEFFEKLGSGQSPEYLYALTPMPFDNVPNVS